VNSLCIVLPSRLDAQDQLAQVGVNIAVMKEGVLVHDRRSHDSTMLHNLPIVCNDFLALPDQGKFAFMAANWTVNAPGLMCRANMSGSRAVVIVSATSASHKASSIDAHADRLIILVRSVSLS
jgi:hypothetical protein